MTVPLCAITQVARVKPDETRIRLVARSLRDAQTVKMRSEPDSKVSAF